MCSEWLGFTLLFPAAGDGLLLSAVIQYILYNNWQRVGGSRHLEGCNPCCAWHYTLCVCVCVFESSLWPQIDKALSTVVGFLGSSTWRMKGRWMSVAAALWISTIYPDRWVFVQSSGKLTVNKSIVAVWRMTAESDYFIIFLARSHNAVLVLVLRFHGDGIKHKLCLRSPSTHKQYKVRKFHFESDSFQRRTVAMEKKSFFFKSISSVTGISCILV